MIAESRSLVLEIPHTKRGGTLGPACAYSALTVGSDFASTSLVKAFLDELIRVHRQLPPTTASRMASIEMDLLVAGIAERLALEVPKPLHGTILVQRVKAFVGANLGDPPLGPVRLATAIAVSVRRLQELFREHGRCIAEWTWERRLETAALRLVDTRCHQLPLTNVTYECGLISQPHFPRRFKCRFGMTPSEYRHEAKMQQFPECQ